jgi:fengycin family lipopeptide synthetase D
MNDKNNIEQIYGLAPLQEGILFHSLADGHAGVYFDQYTLNITGTLDVELLKKSFHQLFRQHEILRAAFVYEGVAKPLQVIVRNRVGEFTYRDLTLKKDPDQIIQTLIAEDKIAYFNLQKDPLMRLKVFRSKSESYVVLLSWHHLIIDGWSLGIVIDDLVRNYKQLLGNPDHEPSVAKGFGSFLQYLKTRDTERDGAFWTNYLNTFSEPTRLLDTVEHYQQGERKKITIDFNAEELGKIKSFCSKHNFTLNTIVQAAWGIVLSSHSGRSDVMFGQVVSGRPFDLSDSDAVVGLFINTIPIRVNTAAANEWIPFLSELQHRFIQSIEYQNYPLHEIQKCTPLKRDLFDHILLFENYPIPDQQQLPFVVNDFRKEDNSNFNLVIEVRDQPFLVIDFKYNTTQFSEKLVEAFAGRLKETVLSAACDVLTKKTQSLPPSDLEKLTRINHTDREWTIGTILDRWNTSVKETPHSIAVVCGDRSYTHAFIDQWSRQLATLLSVKHRVRKNEIVAINPVADIATVVSVIAIMRCGAAYLPIDSKAPIVRLEKMLIDANVKVLLSDDNSITQHLPLVRVIDIEEVLEKNETLIEFDQVSGNDTAYCIFTSGTTGQPKGILINHNSLANYVNWLIHRFNPEKKDRTVILSSLSYDLPMTAFWGSLASGAELHFLHEDTVFNPDEVLRYMVKTSITFIKTTPSVFSLLVNHHNSPATVAALRLRLIFIGGELIRPADIGSYLRHHPKVKFINHYGPTETTIGILTNEIQENDFEDFSSSPTIGYPIDNSKVVIMQPNGTLAPVGVEGEVCLAGAGMFRGYLNAPELTGSKLVAFDAFPGITFYRSGDLGRLRSDGKCILLGRVDRQVKINGYRVDLLEIEAVVKQIAAVKDVVVVKQTDEAERDVLFCYYTSVDQQAVVDLRSHVIKHLPVAFCPAFFMCVEKIPLNANGKVDTNKLLMLALPVATPPVEQTKFANDTEKSIVEVWMRVLGYPHIDSNSSYFDLGGDSIKAIQIASQLRRLGFNVSVKDIYSSKTVCDLAGKMIKRTQDDPVEPQITPRTHVLPPVQWTEEFQSDLGLTVDQVEGMLPLHSLQVGMMHSYLRNPNSQAYQRKTIWKTNELKPAAFEQAINDTYASHQGLRVIFTRGLTQEPLQLVLRKHIASYQIIDIHHLKPGEVEDYVNEFSTHSNTVINLLNGQVPIRWVVFVGKKECYIVLEHHHILLDAWSSYLMLDEIIRRYQVLLADSKIKIPKPAQLASYHYWLTENNQEAARNFWSSYLEGVNQATWVYGRSEIKLETSGPGNIVHEFAEGTLKKLTQIAGQLNGTAFMVIQAIWAVILSKQNNTNEIVFGQEVSGRSADMRDVDQVIGMVINVLPNRVLIGPTMTFADLVSTMMEYDRQVDMVQYYHLSDIFKLTPLRDQLFTHVLSLEPEFSYS